MEALESRVLLTAYNAATAAELIKDINAANKAGGNNTITLTAAADSPYVFTATNNSSDGPTVLPVIKKGNHLTIVTANGNANPGFGDVIDAGKYGRLFDVSSGASLTLQNVTLQHGIAFGAGAAASGGAIYNRGTLTLSDVLVQDNAAVGFLGANRQKNQIGGAGQDASGGAIWSNGSLVVENGTVLQENTAIGGDGGISMLGTGPGGNAFGGAIYIAGGSAVIDNSTLGAHTTQFGNKALGGAGSNGGSGYGGAVYVAAGTVTMDSDIIGGTPLGNLGNIAAGGAWVAGGTGGHAGFGYGGGVYAAGGNVTLTNDSIADNVAGTGSLDGLGGGIYIGAGALVSIDLFTQENTHGNSPDDINGTLPLI